MIANSLAPISRRRTASHLGIAVFSIVAMLAPIPAMADTANDWLIGYWEGKFANGVGGRDIRIRAIDAEGKFTITWDIRNRVEFKGNGNVENGNVTVYLNDDSVGVLKREPDGNLSGDMTDPGAKPMGLTLVKKSNDPAQPAGLNGCDVNVSSLRPMPQHAMGVQHLNEGETLLQLYSRNYVVCHDGHLDVQQP